MTWNLSITTLFISNPTSIMYTVGNLIDYFAVNSQFTTARFVANCEKLLENLIKISLALLDCFLLLPNRKAIKLSYLPELFRVNTKF